MLRVPVRGGCIAPIETVRRYAHGERTGGGWSQRIRRSPSSENALHKSCILLLLFRNHTGRRGMWFISLIKSSSDRSLSRASEMPSIISPIM
jgi:hypothetical protein